jgi:hypothetical protein
MLKQTGRLGKQMMLGMALIVAIGGILVGTPVFAAWEQPRESEPQPVSEAGMRTIDDLFAAVARRVPEFGGMYIDPASDTLVLYLTDTSPNVVADAKAALEEVFGSELPAHSRTTARQAQYGFLQLKDWHDRMNADVLGTPDVVFTDIDDAKNRLAVGVSSTEARVAVEQHLARLDIPREAVNIEDAGPVQPLQSLPHACQ